MSKADLSGVLAQLGGAKTGSKRTPSSSRPQGPGKSVGGGRKYVSATQRRIDNGYKKKAKSKKDGGGGGLFDQATDFGANVVGGALELTDIPRSYIESHIADIAGAAESGSPLDTLGAVAGTSVGWLPQIASGAGHTLGINTKPVDTFFYNDSKHGNDFQEHTGTGQYLERFIKRHPNTLPAKILNVKTPNVHVPGTPIDVGVSVKDALGATGDIALDPATYVAPGASDLVRGGAKAVATHIVEQGAEDAAKITLEQIGNKAAREAAKKAVTSEAAKAADKVLKQGTRHLTQAERVKYLNAKGGLHLRLPGHGRVGRGVGRIVGAKNIEEKTVGLIPKAATDKLNPVLDVLQKAEQKTVGNVAAKFSNKSKLLKKLREGTTTPEEAAQLLAYDSKRVSSSAGREAGLRLKPNEADLAKAEGKGGLIDKVFPGHAQVNAQIGPRVEEAWRGVRKVIKKSGLSDAEVIRKVESGTIDDEATKAVSDFFSRLHEHSTSAGVDVGKRENYIPWQFTEHGKNALEVERGAGGTLSKAGFEHPRQNEDTFRKLLAEQRGVKPEEIATADARDLGEYLGRNAYGDKLKGRSVYETNLDKIVNQQLLPLTQRVDDTNVHAMFQNAGILKKTDKAVRDLQKATAEAEQRSLSQSDQIGKLEKQLRGGATAVDKKMTLADAKASDAAAQDAGAQQLPLWSEPVVEKVTSPAQKEQAYQRALDLGWDATSRPHTIEQMHTGLQDALQKAQLEVQQGVTDGLQSERAKAYEVAAQTQDEAARAAIDYQATSLDMQDQIDRLYKHRNIENDLIARMHNAKHAEDVRQSIIGQVEKLTSDPSLVGNRQLVEFMNEMEKAVGSPAKFQRFLKFYDMGLNNIKAWQLATPGFHVRNFLGGSFNNYIADVDFGRGAQYERLRAKYYRGRLKGVEKDWFDKIVASTPHGQFGRSELPSGRGLISNTVGSNNPYVHLSRSAGARVEEHLRGTLMLDRLAKGRSLDDAIADVVKYHFDYQDLSGFERNVAKRVIPFYAFTRYNTPLQIEMLLQSPGKYSRYYQAQKAINVGSQNGTTLPSSLQSQFGLPTNNFSGGNQVALTPDLPLTQVFANAIPALNQFKADDPIGSTLFGVLQPYVSQVTPLIKAPLEILHGEQLFHGIPLKNEPYRDTDGKLAPNPSWFRGPIAAIVKASGGTVETKQGTRITDNGMYAAEQFMPALARYRKFNPTSKKDKSKQGQAVDSTLGLPWREITKQDQKNERYQRSLKKKKPVKKWWEK